MPDAKMQVSLDTIAKVFRDHDTGGRGAVSLQTLRVVMASIGMDEEEADDVVLLFKQEGQAEEVRYDDFIRWVFEDGAPAAHLSPRARVRSVFEAFDLSKSGHMPVSSLRAVLETIEPNAKDVDAILAESLKVSSSSGGELDYNAWLDWMFGAWRDDLSYYARPRVDLVKVERTAAFPEATPAYASMDEFREKHVGNRSVLEQMRNRVLICPSCGKPNAYTMKACNGCGTSLAGVPESFNDNIFMGFVYGVARGKFPYTISTRRESEELLAFDDPLAVSVVHMCVIPTNTFCPDIRFLFADPPRGLKLIDDLMEFGRQAVLDQYWSNDAFREKYWCGEAPPGTLEELQELVVLGFNFPPSMFQLHLQFMHGPLFPFHEVQARKGMHYHHGRFYPFEYVRAALACGDALRMEVDGDTAMEDIVQRIAAQGIDYDSMHARMMEKCERLSKRFDIWRAQDFEYLVSDGVVTSTETGVVVQDANPVEIQKDDHARMRIHGGTYYRYIKAPDMVTPFALS